MPIWKTPTVSDEPTVSLVRWRIFKADNALHLCGYNKDKYEARISSRIMQIDHDKKTVKTHSGRIYKLQGESMPDADVEYVLSKWIIINKINDFEFLPGLPENL